MYNSNNFIIPIIIIYFILRTHGITQIFPGLWAAPLIIITLHCTHKILTQKKGYFVVLLRESRWIILSIIILVGYVLFDYGNFKLMSTFTYLLSSVPFYIVGFYNGLKFNNDFIKKISFGYVLFISVFLLPKIFIALTSGIPFTSTFVENMDDKAFLLFLPFISFITVFAAFMILAQKKTKFKKVAYATLSINIFAMFLSAKAGPILIILIAFIFYYFKKGSNILSIYRNIIFSTLGVLLVVFSISMGFFGKLGSLKSKSVAFTNLFESGFHISEDVLNGISSNRWSLDKHSVEQFFKKPIFGHGAYLEAIEGMLGTDAEVTTVAGGHSFIFDTMAFYGLFGLPLIFILVKFIKDAVKYYELVKENKEEGKISLIYAALLFGILIANVLNSGFLFSSFDNFLFLLAGFYLGKHHFVTRNRSRYLKPTN